MRLLVLLLLVHLATTVLTLVPGVRRCQTSCRCGQISCSVGSSVAWSLAVRKITSPQTGRQELRTLLECTDPRFVVRTVNVTLPLRTTGVGIELAEMCGTGQNDLGEDREGCLVVVTGLVDGGNAALQRDETSDAEDELLRHRTHAPPPSQPCSTPSLSGGGCRAGAPRWR